MSEPLSYSVKGAASATGVSEDTIYRAIRSGRLRAKKSNENDDGDGTGKTLILRRDLEAWLEHLVDA